jgi:tRNA nucleotidyltransferase (CCA-adding enzyme)
VNAIAWDPLTNEIEDPFNGRADLERRLLRAVDLTTFGDDSLRVLRAVQFAARFEFSLEVETAALCRTIPLDDLPAERIWGEIEKLLLQAERPSIGFALALDLGVIDRVLPEMSPLVGCAQEPEWHPEGDVWVHTLMVIDQARQRNADLDRARLATIMLGAVCHDLGKPATTAFIDGRIRSLDHEQAGVEPTLRLLDRLNVHTMDGFDVREQVVGLVAHHLKPGCITRPATSPTVRFVVSRRRSIWSCWPGLRAPIVWGAPARSIVRQWIGSSSGRAHWASSTSRPNRFCAGVTCLRLGCHLGRESARC